MDYSEYRDGCWLNADGSWNPNYSNGRWKSNSTGWWYGDTSGWYASNCWQKIDGMWYYFGGDGYILYDTTTPDGYYVGADGACVY